MRGSASVSLLVIALGTFPVWAAAAEEIPLRNPAGQPVRWSEWLADHGPAAALVWASWVPGAATTLERLPALESACASSGLTLVVVDVQETLDAARVALERREVRWLHDRHGVLLKRLLVFEIPALVVVNREGEVVARLEADPEALTAWRRESATP